MRGREDVLLLSALEVKLRGHRMVAAGRNRCRADLTT